jgi:hypothetical protein
MDNTKIEKMSNNCIELFNNYFSIYKMHKPITQYFITNINKIVPTINEPTNEPTINEPTNALTNAPTNAHTINDKVVIITQYYIVNSGDKEYNYKRQQEVNYCLQKNIENRYINEVHILLEEELDLTFINNKNNINIVKNITHKRINYYDVFNYCNNNLQNSVCILLNSDIYIDNSIEIVKYINFDKLFISLNRYEKDNDNIPALLHGLEIDDATYKNCQCFLKPYQECIWSQDTWIWKNKISGITDEFNFNLGVGGCDNWINCLMKKINYKILNCSKIISTNHYDKLSVVINEFGISKGNVSNKNKTKIGDRNEYLFLENQDDIPDKYTTKFENVFTNTTHKTIKLSIEKNISEIEVNDYQITASSFSDSLYKPSNVLFKNESYWEPNNNDKTPFIQFNFGNILDIAVIDIKGKELSRNDVIPGYITKFKISYFLNMKWIDDKIYNGMETDSGNCIRKIYLDKNIKCEQIRIYPIEHVNIKSLKIKLYKYDFPKKNIFNFLSNNINYFKCFKETIFDYENINKEPYAVQIKETETKEIKQILL